MNAANAANARKAAARAQRRAAALKAARLKAARLKAARLKAARLKAAQAAAKRKLVLVPTPTPAATSSGNGLPWFVLAPFGLLALTLLGLAVVAVRRRDSIEAALAAPPLPPAARAVPVAPPLPVEPPLAESLPPEAPVVAEVDEPELCTIRAWRGYLKWQFYASVRRGGVDELVAESRSFKSSGNGTPDETPQARAAFEGLVAKVRKRGWIAQESHDGCWFEQSFVRADSDATSPPAEDVFDVSAMLMRHEDEETVALPNGGASARGNGVAVAVDDGDQRVSRQP